MSAPRPSLLHVAATIDRVAGEIDLDAARWRANEPAMAKDLDGTAGRLRVTGVKGVKHAFTEENGGDSAGIIHRVTLMMHAA